MVRLVRNYRYWRLFFLLSFIQRDVLVVFRKHEVELSETISKHVTYLRKQTYLAFGRFLELLPYSQRDAAHVQLTQQRLKSVEPNLIDTFNKYFSAQIATLDWAILRRVQRIIKATRRLKKENENQN